MNKRVNIACVVIAVTAIAVLAGHRIYLHRRIESEISKLESHDQQAIYALGKLGRPAVAPLIVVLKGEDFPSRLFAARALGYIGAPAKPAVPAIIDLLKDEDEAGHVAYKRMPYQIKSLGRIGPEAKAAVPFLRQTLKDDSGWVRADAAWALWDIDRDPRATPTLIEVLKDENETWDARVDASRALGHIGPDAEAAIPALIETLPDPSTGIYAWGALRKIGLAPEHIPMLVQALGDVEKGSVRNHVTAILEKIGPGLEEVVQRHITAIREKDPGGSMWATDFLIKAGPEDVAAVPALTQALEDENPDVRAWAASGLIKIGPVAKEAIPALAEVKNDSEDRVRWRAAMALNVIRRGPGAVIETESRVSAKMAWEISLAAIVVGIVFLQGLSLYRRRPRFRIKLGDFVTCLVILLVAALVFCLWYLAIIREFPFPVGDTMFDLKYGNRSVSSTAVERIELLGINRPDLCVEALKARALRAPYVPISRIGLRTQIHREEGHSTQWLARRAVPVLMEALRHEDGKVREIAATALGNFCEDAKEAVPVLTVALADWSANRAAAVALGKIGQSAEAAVPALLELSEDPDGSVARHALIALVKLEPGDHPVEDVVPELVEALRGAHFQPRITKWDAIIALGELGPDATSAIPELTQMSRREPNERYRRAAAEALEKIQPAGGAGRDEL